VLTHGFASTSEFGASSSGSSGQNGAAAAIDDELLRVLVCPISKTPLRLDADAMELISDDAGVAYPIRDGIARLLPSEGRLVAQQDGAVAGEPQQ